MSLTVKGPDVISVFLNLKCLAHPRVAVCFSISLSKSLAYQKQSSKGTLVMTEPTLVTDQFSLAALPSTDTHTHTRLLNTRLGDLVSIQEARAVMRKAQGQCL